VAESAEPLESRTLLAAAFSQFVDPNPNPGNQFGADLVLLRTGNIVITAPGDDAGGTDAGAVYLFSGSTGTLISTLTGSANGDQIGNGGVTSLATGHFVVSSTNWDNGTASDAGAVTFGNGFTGASGVVSAANSLVGTTSNDSVGSDGVTALTTGNYVVGSSNWDDRAVTDVGAVTFGSGFTGVTGAVSSQNSLVGSRVSDRVGSGGVTALSTGNYVVRSVDWDNRTLTDAGAVTFGSGTAGIQGSRRRGQ
jgi:hypothetical protein